MIDKTKNTGNHQCTAAGEATHQSEAIVQDVPGVEHHEADQGAPALHLQPGLSPAPAVHDAHGEDEPQPEQRVARAARVARVDAHALGAVPVQLPHQEEAAGPPLHIPGDHGHEDGGQGGRIGPLRGRPPDVPNPNSMVRNCKDENKK